MGPVEQSKTASLASLRSCAPSFPCLLVASSEHPHSPKPWPPLPFFYSRPVPGATQLLQLGLCARPPSPPHSCLFSSLFCWFFSSLLMSFRLFLLYTAKTRVLLALHFLDCSILIHVCGSRAANPDSRASPKQQARLGLAGGRNPRATCAALLDWRGRLRGEASNVEQLVGGRVKPQFFVGCSQPRS